MKIGVMTWWRNTNYGGFLQGLALQTFLQENGYDVEMIPFASFGGKFLPYTAIWPQRIKSFRQFVWAVKNAFLALFIDGKPFARMNRLRKTQALVDEYIKTSPREFATLSELNQYGHYDTLIAGSDQIWSPRFLARVVEEMASKCDRMSIQVLNFGAILGNKRYVRSMSYQHFSSIGSDPMDQESRMASLRWRFIRKNGII